MRSKIERKEKIQLLRQAISSTDRLISDWTEEAMAKGEVPERDLSIRYGKMIRMLEQSWLASEEELLAAEGVLRKRSISRRDLKSKK